MFDAEKFKASLGNYFKDVDVDHWLEQMATHEGFNFFAWLMDAVNEEFGASAYFTKLSDPVQARNIMFPFYEDEFTPIGSGDTVIYRIPSRISRRPSRERHKEFCNKKGRIFSDFMHKLEAEGLIIIGSFAGGAGGWFRIDGETSREAMKVIKGKITEASSDEMLGLIALLMGSFSDAQLETFRVLAEDQEMSTPVQIWEMAKALNSED